VVAWIPGNLAGCSRRNGHESPFQFHRRFPVVMERMSIPSSPDHATSRVTVHAIHPCENFTKAFTIAGAAQYTMNVPLHKPERNANRQAAKLAGSVRPDGTFSLHSFRQCR
jgi:hypothetical protein